MRYWFDTEFIEDGLTIDLLSIGIVAEDGRELYLECGDTDTTKASDWVREHVFIHMSWEDMYTKKEIAKAIVDFVGDDKKPHFWAWYCVTPETKVLTADLRWVQAGEVKEGDRLVGFDEHKKDGSGRSGQWRKWRETEVTESKRMMRPCYTLEFDDGTIVTCSAEHQWLVYSGYQGAEWVTTENLVADGPKSKSCVVKPLDVWSDDTSRDGGYLAAALDGEGHLTQRSLQETGGPNSFQTRIGFSQRRNAMLSHVENILTRKEIAYTTNITTGDVPNLSIGNRNDVFRILGEIRPVRLLNKFDPGKMGAMSLSTVKLIRKTDVGVKEVAAFTTSTGTFVAEGLASHNCSYDWVALCQLYGTMMDLPKHFPRFARDFRQWLESHPDEYGNEFRLNKLPEDVAHNALTDARWLRDEFKRLWLPPMVPLDVCESCEEAFPRFKMKGIWCPDCYKDEDDYLSSNN